jgi:hypothetical protein
MRRRCREPMTFSIFSYLRIQSAVFQTPDKAVILSEALRRSIANGRLYGAESKDPGDACWQMLLGAFRPQTTTEDKKVTNSDRSRGGSCSSTDPSWRCFVRTSGEIRSLLIRKTVYSSAFTNPRSFSIGAMLGSRPNHALYIAAGSSVFPRESTMWRRRSPLARVRPPLSRNH